MNVNMDGNFNWEQMKQSDTQLRNDVSLHNGEGFMVEGTRFAQHSKARIADKPPVCLMRSLIMNSRLILTQKSTCSNHKAVSASITSRSANLQVTGIGACACRHSFFIPSSVVNFSKGEKYV